MDDGSAGLHYPASEQLGSELPVRTYNETYRDISCTLSKLGFNNFQIFRTEFYFLREG